MNKSSWTATASRNGAVGNWTCTAQKSKRPNKVNSTSKDSLMRMLNLTYNSKLWANNKIIDYLFVYSSSLKINKSFYRLKTSAMRRSDKDHWWWWRYIQWQSSWLSCWLCADSNQQAYLRAIFIWLGDVLFSCRYLSCFGWFDT